MPTDINQFIKDYQSAYEDEAKLIYSRLAKALKVRQEQDEADDSESDIEIRKREMDLISRKMYELACAYCIEHQQPIADDAGSCPPDLKNAPRRLIWDERTEFEWQNWLSQNYSDTWPSRSSFSR